MGLRFRFSRQHKRNTATAYDVDIASRASTGVDYPTGVVFSQKPAQEAGQGFIGLEGAHYIDRCEGGGLPSSTEGSQHGLNRWQPSRESRERDRRRRYDCLVAKSVVRSAWTRQDNSICLKETGSIVVAAPRLVCIVHMYVYICHCCSRQIRLFGAAHTCSVRVL